MKARNTDFSYLLLKQLAIYPYVRHSETKNINVIYHRSTQNIQNLSRMQKNSSLYF